MKRLDLVVGTQWCWQIDVRRTHAGRGLLPCQRLRQTPTRSPKQRWPRWTRPRTRIRAHGWQQLPGAKLIELGKSFIRGKRVLPSGQKLELIDAARTADYTIVLHVLLIPEELAVERVRHTGSSAGGHDVPEDKISRTVPTSLGARGRPRSTRCDSATVYDNSGLKGPPRIVATK